MKIIAAIGLCLLAICLNGQTDTLTFKHVTIHYNEYDFQVPTCEAEDRAMLDTLPEKTVKRILEIKYPECTLVDKTTEKFLNDTIRGFVKSICADRTTLKKPYKGNVNKNYCGIFDKPSENYIDFDVVLNSTGIASIVFRQDVVPSSSTGGSHNTLHPLTVDLKSKTTLTLKDIINPAYTDTIVAIINDYLDSTRESPYNIEEIRQGKSHGNNIALTADKKLVVFLEYSWGHSSSTAPVTINPALYPGMITEKYAWFIK